MLGNTFRKEVQYLLSTFTIEQVITFIIEHLILNMWAVSLVRRLRPVALPFDILIHVKLNAHYSFQGFVKGFTQFNDEIQRASKSTQWEV
jgi:hypothetical protein